MPKIIKKHGKIALILGLILMLIGMYVVITPAQAVTYCTKEKDVLSDSRPETVSDHTIYFVTPTGVHAAAKTITVTFAADFDLTAPVAFGDMDLAIDDDGVCDGDWTDETLAAVAGEGEWGVGVDGQVITFTSPTDAGADEIAAGRCVQIKIGKNATGGAANKQITNPTAGVKDIDIGGNFGDTGKMKVAIIAGVSVTATVAETLSFTIAAVIADDCHDNIGGTDQSDEAGHNASTVPFGTITPETFYFSCQSLQIKTNAENGYTCTVQETDQLKYGAIEFPDGNCNDGTCSETSNGIWTTSTEEGFAYCMHDITGDGAGTATWANEEQCDDGTPEFKIFPEKAVDDPDIETVMSSAAAVSDDTSYIGYKINADYAQTAGAYSNTTIFVVTPTY